MRIRKSGSKSFFGRFKPPRLNARGFSLMEVMVTASILGVVAIGTSVLFSDMFAIQKRGDAVKHIQIKRNEIISAISRSETSPGTYSSAWDRMVKESSASLNPFLMCLRDRSPCPNGGGGELLVRDVLGAEVFDGISTSTRGLGMAGDLCTPYGSALCPFKWVITLTYRCVGDVTKASCENPTVHVEGEFSYSPGSNKILATGVNTKQFNFNIRRGDFNDLNEPIQIVYRLAPGATFQTEAGTSATCKGVGGITRKLEEIEQDPGSNVASLASNRFTLRPGAYECRIQVPAFKSGVNWIQLANTSNSMVFNSPTYTASLSGGSVTIPLQAAFVISADTQFRVQHYCDRDPSDTAYGRTEAGYSLGLPGLSDAGYGGSRFTTVACVKTSD